MLPLKRKSILICVVLANFFASEDDSFDALDTEAAGDGTGVLDLLRSEGVGCESSSESTMMPPLLLLLLLDWVSASATVVAYISFLGAGGAALFVVLVMLLLLLLLTISWS